MNKKKLLERKQTTTAADTMSAAVDQQSDLSYYDNILKSIRKQIEEKGEDPAWVERSPGSAVVGVTGVPGDNTGVDVPSPRKKRSMRLIHIPQIFEFTSFGKPYEYHLGSFKAALLAVAHFNARDESVVINLRQLLSQKRNTSTFRDEENECNLHLTLDSYDSEQSPLHAVAQLHRVIAQREYPYQPAALFGAGRSTISAALATLSASFGFPQISDRSTSEALSNRESFGLFGRVVPSVSEDAKALMDYLHFLEQQRLEAGREEGTRTRHLGLVYLRKDVWSESYALSVQSEARKRNVKVLMAPSDPYSPTWGESKLRSSIQESLLKIKDSGYRSILALVTNDELAILLQEAIKLEILGQPGYSWLFGDSIAPDMIDEVARTLPASMAKRPSLHGIGILTISSSRKHSARLSSSLSEADADEAFRRYVVQKAVRCRFSVCSLQCVRSHSVSLLHSPPTRLFAT